MMRRIMMTRTTTMKTMMMKIMMTRTTTMKTMMMKIMMTRTTTMKIMMMKTMMMKIMMTRTMTMKIWMRMLMDHPDVAEEDLVEVVAAVEAAEEVLVEVEEAVADLAVEVAVLPEEPPAQLALSVLLFLVLLVHLNHLESPINKFTAEDFLEEPVHPIPDPVPIEDTMPIVVTSKINANLPSQCTNHHPMFAVLLVEAELADLAFHTDLCHSIPAELDLHHAASTEMFFKTVDQSPPWNHNHVLWLAEVQLM
jgi:hypothetical protein